MHAQLLDLVESQLVANRLPLMAVSVAALPHANTPVVLSLHWHGFVEVRLTDEGNTVAHRPVPSSALQVNMRWDTLDTLEYDALETAWELGAWNLERTEVRPFTRPGASGDEAREAATAFGVAPLEMEGEPQIVADIPDGDDILAEAGRSGYLQWLFRPVRGGVWEEVAEDVTLERGGYRNPTCPLAAQPVQDAQRLHRTRRVVYPFGRGRW